MKQYVAVCALSMALAGQHHLSASENMSAQDFAFKFRALIDSAVGSASAGKLSESDKQYFVGQFAAYFKDVNKFIKAAPFKAGSQSEKITVLASLEKLLNAALKQMGDAMIRPTSLAKALDTIQQNALKIFNKQQDAIGKGILVDANRERRELLRDIANDISVLAGRAKTAAKES